MREKTAVCTGIIFILALMLVSCAFAHTEARADDYMGEPAVILSHDKTALPEFIYNFDALDESLILGEKRLSSGRSFPTDLPSVSRASSFVLSGRIYGVYYTFIDGAAWTQADIFVSECLRGSVQGGDIVSVYFPGGYVSTEDFEAFYGESGGSEAEFYRLVTDGVPLPQQGDSLLLFLTRPDGAALPEGAYTLSCGKYSIFSLSPDGCMLNRNGQHYETQRLG